MLIEKLVRQYHREICANITGDQIEIEIARKLVGKTCLCFASAMSIITRDCLFRFVYEVWKAVTVKRWSYYSKVFAFSVSLE